MKTNGQLTLLFIKVNRNYKTKDSTIYASMHCCILDNNCREENRNLSHTSFIRWTTTIRHARASLHACKQNHHDKLFLKLVGPMLQKENNSRIKLISSYIYKYIYIYVCIDNFILDCCITFLCIPNIYFNMKIL